MLAVYASQADSSRGRCYAEPVCPRRNTFARDRDRIIHSEAFRRLEYKTQVFVNHEGDLFRTRLTHSLEVAQMARAIARNLNLNEDLSEAIALAHDLGHTPFGHAGQDALNECMHDFGGFEHNMQSLRVVDVLEQRYAEFDGLNLSFETREGILKHCSRQNAATLGEIGARFLDNTRPSFEAQLVNYADEIAYNNHDIDDGVRSGLLRVEELMQVTMFARHAKEVITRYPKIEQKRLVFETIRRIIDCLISDLCKTSLTNITQASPLNVGAVRQLPALIGFSELIARQNAELKKFLREKLYRHPTVYQWNLKAQDIVRGLFAALMEQPTQMSDEFATRMEDRPRAVADYIAGMTDRYAIAEFQRLCATTVH